MRKKKCRRDVTGLFQTGSITEKCITKRHQITAWLILMLVLGEKKDIKICAGPERSHC